MLTQHLLILTNNDTSYSATLVTSLFACFFCLEVPVEGRGEGAGERRGATSRWDDRLSNHKRQRGSPIASALVSAIDRLSTSGSEAGAGLELWRDVAALGWRWQVTRGWGRGGETFSATAACQPFTEFLQLILCLQFSRRCGRGEKRREKSPSFGPANK